MLDWLDISLFLFIFSLAYSDSFLSLSSALTVLKQEIPSPFGPDQVKKIAKTSAALIKEQVDEISHIDQVQPKNGNIVNANVGGGGGGNTATSNNNNANNNGNVNGVAVSNTVAVPSCHLNGNSNSNSSTELVNCLENVAAQHQSNANDLNDERNESNSLSMNVFDLWILKSSFI